MSGTDPLLAPIPGAETRELAGIKIDTVRAGAARVKRLNYPPGFRWSKDVKPLVGTDLCTHAHVGFLARGRIDIQYGDGCMVSLTAPAVVSIDPGHDAWIVGDEPAILIEFDFEAATISRMGVPESHSHANNAGQRNNAFLKRIIGGIHRAMLLLRSGELSDGPGWLREVKLDGYRTVAFRAGVKVQLRSRNDNEFGLRHPAIAKSLTGSGRATVHFEDWSGSD